MGTIALFANTDWYLYNFRLHFAEYLSSKGHRVVLISPDGSYVERIRQSGFAWRELKLERRSVNPITQLSTITQLARIYKEEGVTVAHHFTLKCVVLGSIAATCARTPAVVNAVAGMGYLFSSTDLKAALLRPIMRLALILSCNRTNVRVIVQNHDDEKYMGTLTHTMGERTRVIYGSGVDTDKFSAIPKCHGEGEQNSRITVLLVSRLLYDKGIKEFVEAAQLCRRDPQLRSNCRFILVGGTDTGNPGAVRTEQLNRWIAEADVEFAGHVDDIQAWISMADIVVLPSYREGLPRSLVEAAASEKALITTDVPGCNEVVNHGENGLLVGARNSTALASAITKLIASPEDRRRMGAAGRKRAVEKFDKKVVNDSTYETYLDLLQRN